MLVKFTWLFSEITINSNLFVVACALLDMEFPISSLKTKIQPSGTSEGVVLGMAQVLETLI